MTEIMTSSFPGAVGAGVNAGPRSALPTAAGLPSLVGSVPARFCHTVTDAGGRKGRPYGTENRWVSEAAR